MHCWLKTQIGPYAVNLSLSSAVVKLKTMEEWDLVVLNMFTFAQKYSMSGRAEMSVLPVNIFPISTV